ncbi:hypothetical protein A2U01_0065779, partial [Trifolium medium]|nr:hypothetical protein [Trifolium medium]
AYASPVKRSQDSGESEDDNPDSEDKGAEGTATEVVVPKKKITGKEKLGEVVKEKEKRKRIVVSESEKAAKKSKTHKNKGPKVVRKLTIHEEDDEETEE